MKNNHLVAAATTAVLLATGCGGGGGSEQTGSLRLALTDAPACGFDQINVRIDKVRVHRSAAAGESDAGWSELAVNAAQSVNLLDLTNGVLQELGTLPLPAGRYQQMRLVLAPSGHTALATGSSVPTALEPPSGAASGLKMNVNIEVPPDRLADAVIDFDACRSVVSAGASGRLLLKPVLQVTPRYVSGVTGQLDAALLATPGASVSLQQNGVVRRATVPDAQGRFTLAYMAPGDYDLVLTAPGRATAVVGSVPVTAEQTTRLPGLLTAPPSPTGQVQGTVNRTEGEVRALQTLASRTVEVGAVQLGGTGSTSSYGLTLPTAAPQVATYDASILRFAPAPAAAAGAYTLQLQAGGTALGTQAVTLGTAPVTASFTLN